MYNRQGVLRLCTWIPILLRQGQSSWKRNQEKGRWSEVWAYGYTVGCGSGGDVWKVSAGTCEDGTVSQHRGVTESLMAEKTKEPRVGNRRKQEEMQRESRKNRSPGGTGARALRRIGEQHRRPGRPRKTIRERCLPVQGARAPWPSL